ncbi:ribosome small subunit-dependent GTPase A [bacterium]|nr:ribosome small subunit-dependent GTPase A [bacterium]
MTAGLLASLGWAEDLAAQLSAEEVATASALRVTAVHRARIEALGPEGAVDLIPASTLSTSQVAVGDWLLARDGVALRVLDRRSLVARKAAGTGVARQVIAANLDTLLIVSSCNADFNAARMERFLVLAASAGVEPVVVLTKVDTCPDPESFRAEAAALKRGLAVVLLDAKRGDVRAALAPWCKPGRTVALLGSSGVGKTTIANALTGGQAPVQDIRDDDAKGRHTTTGRCLVAMAQGGWLIDTPGMREVQLSDAFDGIGLFFDDLTELALQCKFRNCTHQAEPGCALRAAIAAGEIDAVRLDRWQKLLSEDQTNSDTLQTALTRAASGRRGPGKRKPGR